MKQSIKFETDSAIDTIKSYFEMLGGDENHFSPQTANRVQSFGMELDRKRNYGKFTTFASDCDEMIIGNHLRLFSFCEHHLLPFYGEAAIGYIPNGKIFGLLKFQRLVDMVASKLQTQEKLTADIMKELKDRLNPLGIGVVLRAIHTCIFARGAQSTKAEFITNGMYGKFKENHKLEANFFHAYKDNNICYDSVLMILSSQFSLMRTMRGALEMSRLVKENRYDECVLSKSN